MTAADERPAGPVELTSEQWEDKLRRLIGGRRAQARLDLVTDPELPERVQQARTALDQAQRAVALAGDTPSQALIDETEQAEQGLAAAEAALADGTVNLTLRAVPATVWHQLLMAHPPEEGSGLRVEPRGFMPVAIAACIADGDVTREQVEVLFDYLSYEHLQQIFTIVWRLNVGSLGGSIL